MLMVDIRNRLLNCTYCRRKPIISIGLGVFYRVSSVEAMELVVLRLAVVFFVFST